ncbi:hypothetical protein [Leisingera sp. JC1]|uniref:hypothetical protein n=1 Tax=Leisingera sp. JC1 TaxID=1855282 RepID=UPI000AC78F7D|nr:hypothetical protein [Leisingera sp. JC1]
MFDDPIRIAQAGVAVTLVAAIVAICQLSAANKALNLGNAFEVRRELASNANDLLSVMASTSDGDRQTEAYNLWNLRFDYIEKLVSEGGMTAESWDAILQEQCRLYEPTKFGAYLPESGQLEFRQARLRTLCKGGE